MAKVHTNLKFSEIYFGEKLAVEYSVEKTDHESYKWSIQSIDILGHTNIQWLLLNSKKVMTHLSNIIDKRAKQDWRNAQYQEDLKKSDNHYSFIPKSYIDCQHQEMLREFSFTPGGL